MSTDIEEGCGCFLIMAGICLIIMCCCVRLYALKNNFMSIDAKDFKPIEDAIKSINDMSGKYVFDFQQDVSLHVAYIKIFHEKTLIYKNEYAIAEYVAGIKESLYRRALQDILIHGLSNLVEIKKLKQ